MNQEVNSLRILAIDMIEKANSGHPGICMGVAPTMYTLYNKILRIDPNNEKWFNRDRFVLSAGHGSAILYSTLHMAGYNIKMEDLQQFRQLNSLTPGHPEYNHTPGVEATTGPLGQGLAQAVGMAMSQKHLGSRFNNIIDNNIYVLCGDGDLQEGITHEASSLAGHLNLNNLVIMWDANNVQLDDYTEMAISEDTMLRYESYGFETFEVIDGENVDELYDTLTRARDCDKPAFVKINTVIGYGSPNKGDSSACHGAPLGSDEVKLVRQNYEWNLEPFMINNEIYDNFQAEILKRASDSQQKWEADLEVLRQENQELYTELMTMINDDVNYDIPFNFTDVNQATRVSSGQSIQLVNDFIPNLIGGSADLSKSNNSMIDKSKAFSKDDYTQKNISFGVREFAMAAITNGMMLYGGVRAYNATFFVFSDYLKAAIRLSALQSLPTIYVLTHDSVAVGEDGPTHEPVEQLAGLRAIPNVNVLRPADMNETLMSWKMALNTKNRPSILVLTRQGLPTVTTEEIENQALRGGYIIKEANDCDYQLIASGSEVHLALQAAEVLEKEGKKVQVVSMLSTNIFDQQTEEYRQNILQHRAKSIYIEMSSDNIAYKYAENVINIETFGLSAPGSAILEELGFTTEQVVEKVKKIK